MRNSIFPPSVLAAMLSACATESVILNSERIEQRFGSYGIEVLENSPELMKQWADMQSSFAQQWVDFYKENAEKMMKAEDLAELVFFD